jgi:HlyD family secretion protein
LGHENGTGSPDVRGRGRRDGTAVWRRWAERVRPHRRSALTAAAAIVAAIAALIWLMPERVDTLTIERREVIETLVTAGRVQSVSRAGLAASLVGTVDGVHVEEGDRVDAGQVLVSLAAEELRAAAAEARARVAAAEASQHRMITVEQPSAAATLQAAELEGAQLEREVERLRRLLDAGAVSQRELEVAQRAAEFARSRLEAARATARSLAEGGADHRAAEVAVELAREALAAALARLELTRVRAPAGGTVVARQVEPGEGVQPGRVLMEIALDGPTELVAFPDERSLSRLRLGQRATASADAYPQERIQAFVDWIAPVVDPEQGTIEVRLGVPEPPAYLAPDMTVSVNIELDRRSDVTTLPLDVVRDALTDSPWVLVVRDGRAIRVPIKVRIRDERYIEIRAGLEEGERVVAGADRVQPGDRVHARRPR